MEITERPEPGTGNRCRFEAGSQPEADAQMHTAETPEPPLETRFAVLAQICRAQHFAWRQAVVEMCPEVDAADVGTRMWEITARETAKAYLRRLDLSKPLPPQLAQHFAWSSTCMDEAVTVTESPAGDEAQVIHHACPWFDWHTRLGLLAEDRSGCDAWFFTVVDEVAKATAIDVRIETIATLPDDACTCTRRITQHG